MIKLLHFLRIVKAVWLKDFQGKPYLTWKIKNPFGGYYAHVYPFMATGYVNLLKNGECSGESSYIKKWKDYSWDGWRDATFENETIN